MVEAFVSLQSVLRSWKMEMNILFGTVIRALAAYAMLASTALPVRRSAASHITTQSTLTRRAAFDTQSMLTKHLFLMDYEIIFFSCGVC